MPFRQNRGFFFLTGCNLADCSVTYDIEQDELTLYIPPIDVNEVLWSGLPSSTEECRRQYDVDDVKYGYDLPIDLHSSIQHGKKRLEINSVQSAVDEARLIKDEYEIDLISRANDISALAHQAVLRQVQNVDNERELHALFVSTCMENGAIHQAYEPIIAAGKAASTLHYVHNDQPLPGKQLVLVDAAAECDCYCADVTRHSRYAAQCLDMIKPGISWAKGHLHAHRVAIKGLLELGILVGPKDQIYEAGTSVVFFPHGLGHLLGLEIHDVAGAVPLQDVDVKLRYLRLRRNLQANMVITVEPGIYFNDYILEAALKNSQHRDHINLDKVKEYRDVGGVRIEDDVVVTADGYRNLTKVPKAVEEIEKFCLQ